MGQVFGKSMGEIEEPCREEYEVIKHEKRIEYTIRKYEPYIAARLLTHNNNHYNDGLFPLCSYGRGIRSGGSIISPQNTTQEFLLPESYTTPICTPHYAQEEFMSITPIPPKKAACEFEFEFEFEPERPSIWELRLPKKYTSVGDAPQPWDKRVVLTKVEGTTCAVAEIGRPLFMSKHEYARILAEEADRLWETVEKDGYTVSGDPFLVGGSRGRHDEIQIRIPVAYLNEEASTKQQFKPHLGYVIDD